MSDEIDEDSTMNFDLEYEELGDDSFTDTESPHSKVEVFEELSYQIIDSDQVFQEMDKLIKEVDIILQLPSKMTRMLLSHFNWNTDKVLNE
jgi:ariadne-1